MIKAHTEWTTEELLKQEQVNFSAHIALILDYLQQQGLSVDDFIRYIGDKAVLGWKRTATDVADFMNGILLNVRSNGGRVLDIYIDNTHANATVTELLDMNVVQYYSVAPNIADCFWNKYVPIAEALGMRFTWERTENRTYVIKIVKDPGTLI